jgi:glycerol-3-phosphate dehydrogenase (NAD+)
VSKEDDELMYRGSAIARIAGHNAKKHSDLFEEEVKIWVFEEEVRSTQRREAEC